MEFAVRRRKELPTDKLAKNHNSLVGPKATILSSAVSFCLLCFTLKVRLNDHYPYDRSSKNRFKMSLAQCCNLPLF